MDRQWGGESMEACGGCGREQTPLPPLLAEMTPRPPEEQFQFQSQQQVQQEVIPAPTVGRLPAPANPGGGEGCPGLERGPQPARDHLSQWFLPASPLTPEPGTVETEPTEPGPLGKRDGAGSGS